MSTSLAKSARESKATSIPLGDVPDHDAWPEYKTYRACQLPDLEKTKLQVGDKIYVAAGVIVDDGGSKKKAGKGKSGRKSEQKADRQERWLARIEQIRALNKVDVFLKISWYYSADQLRSIGYKHVKHLNLQGGELVHTDHTEIIPVSTCEDRAVVYEYDECDENQVQIASDDYFVRYKTILLSPAKKDSDKWVKVPSGPDAKLPLPEPIQPPSSTSGQAYEPLPLSSETRMHYCPKPGCKIWYHIFDLTNGSRDRTSADAVEFERSTGEGDDVAGSVNGDDTLDLNNDGKRALSPDGDDEAGAKKIKTNDGDVAKVEKAAKEAIYDPARVADLPASILLLARAPIVRGSEASGIVGTAQAILAARRIMRDVCAKGEDLPEDWAEQISLFEPGPEPNEEPTDEDLVDCDTDKAIESVRVRMKTEHDTWVARNARAELLKDASESEMGGADGHTVFVCPSCLNLI